MKKLLSILFAFVLVLSFSLVTAVPTVAVGPSDYYVATTGSDAFGDGTETWVDTDESGDWSAGDTGPWLTINFALPHVPDTSTINVGTGTYDPFTIDARTSLTIRAVGDVSILGAQQDVLVFYKSPADLVVFVKDSTDIVLDGLNIEGSGLADDSGEQVAHGVLYQASTGAMVHCRVSPNTVGNMYTLAVAVISTGFVDGGVSDVTLETCRVENYGRVGVYIRGIANINESSIEGQVYSGEDEVCYGVEVEQVVSAQEPTTGSLVSIYHTEIYNNDNTFSPAPTWDSDGILINGWLEYHPQADNTVRIEECDIYDNYGGIYAIKSPSSYVHWSGIHDNRAWGVNSPPSYDASTAWFDAENNWWGTGNGPTHAGNTYNVGMQGDVASNFVDYVPWIGSTLASFAPVTSSEDGDFSSIQAAIDASCGTTITCAAGIFSENVDLDKSLVLTSGSLPVINGDTNGDGVPDGSCITVSADEVTIYGFELTNGYNGIIGQTSGSTIQKCIIHDNLNYVGSNGVGILLWGKNDNNQILENEIYNNDRQGIFIGHCNWGEPAESLVSTENIIAGNTIYNNGLYTQKNGPDASVYGIQLWNADFNTIENNEIYGHIGWDLVRDPEGARPFDWSQGIYLCGSYANLVRYNYIHENGTGVGIAFIYRVPGEPNEIHFNNFCGNEEYGIWNRGHVTDLDFDTVNAQNNWWCHASGPSHSPGSGDPVSGNVLYDPWLLAPFVPGEEPTTFDKTLALNIGWTLVSTDNWIDATETVGEGVILALNYIPGQEPGEGWSEATPADLVPVNALYLKMEEGGGLGINYSGGVPSESSKNLVTGWNLISSATETNARAILSPLRYIDVGDGQGVGLATLVSQGDYNQHTGSFYLATLGPGDWMVLGGTTLNPFDGYWVYMNAPKVFGVVPD